MDIRWIDFQKHGDDRGNLVVAEYGKEIPFVVKRIYYLYGVGNGKSRGYHSHKNLQQVYIPICGTIKVRVDDGKTTEEIVLDDATKGLYFGKKVWREIYDFSPNAVLLVLASDVFSEDDYIRNHGEFLKYLEENK